MTPVRFTILLICPVLTCVAWPARGQALSERERIGLFTEALDAFDEGSNLRATDPSAAAVAFHTAIARFSGLIDSGVRSGKLHYNLANAQLQVGQLGRSIANYRRAERLIPGNDRVEANLRFARSLCRNQIAPAGGRAAMETLFAWHYGTPVGTRFHVGLAAYILFWAVLLARVYLPGVRWGYAAAALLLVWCTLGVSVFVEETVQSDNQSGVMVADDVVVRKGNGDSYDPQFNEPLHAGVEFEIVESRGEWLLIHLPDDNEGWIPARAAEII